MSEHLALNMELSAQRISQYLNYNFNSFCKFGDAYLGAGADGIMVLDDDGGLDNAGGPGDATEIYSFFELSTSDFGSDHQKRLRSIYLGGETDGDLKVSIKNDDRNERLSEVNVAYTQNYQHSIKVPVSRSGKGRYWMLKLENVDGADFSIDTIAVVPIILNRKPGNF